MPIRQLVADNQQHLPPGTNTTGPKSRNPGTGKGNLRQGNSLGGAHKNGSFGAMSSKSPVMAKSFAIPSTTANNNYLNQS